MNFEDSFKQLQELFNQGDFNQVLSLGEALLDEHDDQFDLYLLLANAAIKTSKIADADYYLIKAKRLDANATEPLFLMASIKLLSDDTIGAQDYLEQVLAIDANNVKATTALGELFYGTGLYDAATAQYNKAVELGAAKQLSADEFALLIYKAASSYLANAETEAALDFIQKNEPTDFQEMVWLVKRKVYTAIQDAEQIKNCTEVLHKNVPNQASYIFDLVPYLNAKEDCPRAVELYGKALTLEITEEEKSRAFQGRADLYMKEENWAEALKDLTSLVEIKEDWFAYRRRSTVNEKLKNVKAALQDITKALKLVDTPYDSLYLQRGELWLKASKYDEAIEDFNKVLAITKKTSADAFYNLGVAYSKKGDKSNAFKMLVQAEMLGYVKAKELLLKNFSAQLAKVRTQKAATFAKEFEGEHVRNSKSPILTQAFNKPWVPNMPRFLKTIEEEIRTYPSAFIKDLLAETAKDIFLITPDGILFVEGSDEPIEAYYRVEVESQHSILLEIQPTKGGKISTMKIGFYEGNLMVTYPVGDVEVAPKYFVEASNLNEDQKNTLTTKNLEITYMDSIEQSIATLVAD